MRSVAHTLGAAALTLGAVVFVVTAALGLAAFLLAARRLREDPDRTETPPPRLRVTRS